MRAQEIPVDSIMPVSLDDVVIISKKESLQEQQEKPLASLEDFLEESSKISMLARGGYAWEPLTACESLAPVLIKWIM